MGDIASIITKARENKGMSRYAVAKKSGLAYSFYCKIEDGKSKTPSFQNICNIANILHIDLNELNRGGGST